MILNCVTIDDEPLALGLINSFVERTPFLRLRASYGSASAAVLGIEQPGIHLVFIDIHMPGKNGIDIARLLHRSGKDPQPRVVFTTAYNQFAAESYRVEALDYLLKPFEYEDFLEAARKGLRLFETKEGNVALKLLKEEALYVRTRYQQVRIAWQDIRYIQGMKDYAVIHLKGSDKNILTLTTLKSLNDKLPADRFMRVQRSFIVSLDSVTALTAGSLWLDDTEISIGEQYKAALHALFDKLR